MTKAIVTLEGIGRLEGEADIGGDYVRLTINGRKDVAAFNISARGEIEIDGRTSEVALENASPAAGADDGIVLTMRLFKPIG